MALFKEKRNIVQERSGFARESGYRRQYQPGSLSTSRSMISWSLTSGAKCSAGLSCRPRAGTMVSFSNKTLTISTHPLFTAKCRNVCPFYLEVRCPLVAREAPLLAPRDHAPKPNRVLCRYLSRSDIDAPLFTRRHTILDGRAPPTSIY